MKRIVIAAATVVAAVAVVVGSAGASGGPLYEVRGIGCGVFDRDGSLVLTFDSYLVQYASGKVYLRCEADGTPGATMVKFEGFTCGLAQFGLTTQSTNVVRREGRIQLTCTGFSKPGDSATSTAGVGAG